MGSSRPWGDERAALREAINDDARQALGGFVREACQLGLRCVRVVHGWRVQKNEVLAFVQARPADGGAGAVVVLLQPSASA